MVYRYTENIRTEFSCSYTIEILDLECVLCHVTGVQNENKNALINRGALYTKCHGASLTCPYKSAILNS